MIALVVLSGLIGVSIAVVFAVGYSVYQSYADDLIPPDEAIAKLPRGGARILDRNGVQLYQFVDDVSGINEPLTLEELRGTAGGTYLVGATVATEDASFFDNPGVNIEGLAAATIDNFWPFGDSPGLFEGRGGSSITQQLVKNVYFPPEERGDRTVSRKLKETVLALELTREYEKDQILMWYLNLISYGNIYNGIQAASEGYFGKDATDLTLAEAATLAGIPACPTCYDPINAPDEALARRNYVLRRMYEEDYIDGGQLYQATAQPLGAQVRPFPVEAPHFVFNVVEPELIRRFGEEAVSQEGLVVYTTLDLQWQHKAEDALEGYIAANESSGGHNGAAVGIDPKTAETIIYVGSRDYFNEDILGQNDMADALNSPGSSFKPIMYLTSFIKNGWGPGVTIMDTPLQSKYWDGARPPRNPVAHSGPITIRNALGNSLNIPAVKTILYTGVPEVVEQAEKMGITGLDPSFLGPSMTVGGVDVKLNDMVYAFSVFPNLGMLKGVDSTVERDPTERTLDPVSILRVEDRDGNVLYPKVDEQPVEKPVLVEERVAPPEESYMITDILSDSSAHCITYGCGYLTIPGHPIAMKTGTSEPYEFNAIGDTWTIGYTPQLVFGTWFGNADNSPMYGINSTTVSTATVKEFMAAYHAEQPVEQFTRPEGLSEASLCIPSWLLPTASCPVKTPNDLFATRSLPSKADDWWQVVLIDTRTNKLANDLTPEQFVEERRYLNIPSGLTEFAHDEAMGWQYVLQGTGGAPPTEQTDPSDIPAVINSPANGMQADGVLSVLGRASSEQFESYRLEYHSEGGDWVLLMESTTPVEDGVLGVWDTTPLPVGLYTLRLTVVDGERGDLAFSVQIVVVAPGDAEPLPTAAEPTPIVPGGARQSPGGPRPERGGGRPDRG
jgi:membrane peptidoglycan carboxypeptidase